MTFSELVGMERDVITFYFIDTATPEIYTLSLHDALPILIFGGWGALGVAFVFLCLALLIVMGLAGRSEEHTSELQSHVNLVCRLLLEKKNGRREDDAAQRTVLVHTGG